MSEPKLTAPQRRYEIIDDSDTAHSELLSAFGEQRPALFDVELADVYEGDLPIPEEILRRKIGMIVLELTCGRRTGDVRAFGSTVENSAETVSVHIPKDRTKSSTLQLLDISSVTKAE